MSQIIECFRPEHLALWGRHTVKLRHSLHKLDLFSEGSLADLIATCDPKHVQIRTMARDGHDLTTWRQCERGDLSGADVLAAARHGRIWINIGGISEIDSRFASLLNEMYAELQGHVPGFRPYWLKLGLLISSPNAQVFYHSDIPGQGLWQIAGRKRIYIYPNTEPFLMPRDMENVARLIQEEDIPYQPWFDDHAEVHELEPGDMLHWALNGPHRVVNSDSLNVSLTTEHWTDEIRRHYTMNVANGILRSEIGWTPRSRATSGPSFLAKAALAKLWNVTGLNKRDAPTPQTSHAVDPSAPDGVRPLAG